jgi:hypothetical protein
MSRKLTLRSGPSLGSSSAHSCMQIYQQAMALKLHTRAQLRQLPLIQLHPYDLPQRRAPPHFSCKVMQVTVTVDIGSLELYPESDTSFL